MELIKYICCDTATSHPSRSFHRNDKGSDSWILMCFNTDFVYFSGKEMKKGEKYQCILHPPYMPVIHGPAPEMKTGFENDWIYFYGGEADKLVAELEIPINESFFVENGNCLTSFINAVKNEERMPGHYSEYYISSVIQNMLIYIARQRMLAGFKDSNSYNSVKSVRENMLENYHEKYDLKKLSAEAGYSVSRFCELYKKFYGSSPIADLIDIRIKKAEYYLLFTDTSISEISELCGFETVHYFSALFKKMTGVSPLKYRNSGDKGK